MHENTKTYIYATKLKTKLLITNNMIWNIKHKGLVKHRLVKEKNSKENKGMNMRVKQTIMILINNKEYTAIKISKRLHQASTRSFLLLILCIQRR